jgi:hypothetical protein
MRLRHRLKFCFHDLTVDGCGCRGQGPSSVPRRQTDCLTSLLLSSHRVVAAAGGKDRRPFLASDCNDLQEAEKWRREILKEITKKVSEIQNGMPRVSCSTTCVCSTRSSGVHPIHICSTRPLGPQRDHQGLRHNSMVRSLLEAERLWKAHVVTMVHNMIAEHGPCIGL